MPVNAWDSAGTAQGQAGTSGDKVRTRHGQTGTNRDIPCLSLYVPVCPCLSLSVHVCLYICYSFMFTPTYKYNISMNKVTLTFFSKATVPIHGKLVLTFFFTFHLASSITLSFNPNSYILVINIANGSTWFLSNLVFQCKLM